MFPKIAWDTAGHTVNIQSRWLLLHSPGKEANSHAAAFPVSPLYEAITPARQTIGTVASSSIQGLGDLRVDQLPVIPC